MFNLSKIFNKKLSGKLLGVKAPYSVSFINCQMDWYEVPILKKMTKKNYPTLDNSALLIASYGQTKSDVILRIFVNAPSDDLAKYFQEFQENDFLKLEDVNKLLLPIIGIFKIKAEKYKISKADSISIGDSKSKVLRITGRTERGLGAVIFSETVFVWTPAFLLVFDLSFMDEDEPKADIIKSDFAKILGSIKFLYE